MRNKNKKQTESIERFKEKESLMNFLKLTKNGKYAKIEKSSLDYARAKEETEYYDQSDDEYFFSIT